MGPSGAGFRTLIGSGRGYLWCGWSESLGEGFGDIAFAGVKALLVEEEKGIEEKKVFAVKAPFFRDLKTDSMGACLKTDGQDTVPVIGGGVSFDHVDAFSVYPLG
jgi:hypothetical protein